MSIIQYRRERKIQRPALIAAEFIGLAFSVLGPFTLFNALVGVSSFGSAFLFLHSAYLALKYRLVDLTFGYYAKEQKAAKYWLFVFIFLLAGTAFSYRSMEFIGGL